MSEIQIDGEHLTLTQLYGVVFDATQVELAPLAREKMNASRAVIERLVESGATVYGVNTGFGKMASVRISRDQIRQLQVNLVRSHACGIGAPLTEHETRAMLVLRANAIAKGLSGVRPIVAETLCAMLNYGIHPLIPCQGSVGASEVPASRKATSTSGSAVELRRASSHRFAVARCTIAFAQSQISTE